MKTEVMIIIAAIIGTLFAAAGWLSAARRHDDYARDAGRIREGDEKTIQLLQSRLAEHGKTRKEDAKVVSKRVARLQKLLKEFDRIINNP